MPDDLRSLLGAERMRPGMPDAARARLMARLGLPLIDPGEGGGGGGGHPRPPGSSAAQPVAGTPPSSVVAAAGRAPKIAVAGARWFAASTFAVGLLGGALVHSVYDRAVDRPTDRPRDRWSDRAAPSSVAEAAAATRSDTSVALNMAAVPVAAPLPPPAAPQSVIALASPPPFSPTPAHEESPAHRRAVAAPVAETHKDPAERDVDLGTERALIEIARTSLSRGQSDASIAALERHARQFPHGRLVEERDSVWVQALVQMGKGPEARARAERFRRQFPTSFLLPAVDAALKSIQ